MNLKSFPNIEKLAEPRQKVKVLRAGFLNPEKYNRDWLENSEQLLWILKFNPIA